MKTIKKNQKQKFDKLLNKIWTYLCFLSFPLFLHMIQNAYEL